MNKFKDFPQLQANNPFAEHFQQFQETRLFKRLEKKFTPLPYYLKYRLLYWLTIAASYLFNVFSAITASTLVYFFVFGLSQSVLFSVGCTIAFIIIIEIAKRKTNGVFFKDWLQFKKISFSLLAISLLLLALSVTFSYFGSKQLVQNFSESPELIANDTIINPLQAQIKAIDEQIADARNTRWHGTTTSKSQKTIEILSMQKLALQDRLLNVANKTDADNENINVKHSKAVYLKAEYFALVTLLLELGFIFCAFYIEYYDYRSYAEFSTIKADAPDTTPPIEIVPNFDKGIPIETDKLPVHIPPEVEQIIKPDTKDAPVINGTHKSHTDKSIIKTCQICGTDISTKRKDAKFCSQECRKASWKKVNGREPYLKAKK